MKGLFFVFFIFALNVFAVQRDYYEVLEVDRSASLDEIKGKYRKLALKFHPDRNAHLSFLQRHDLEERFKEVSAAYEVLSDSEKRAVYDRMGFSDSYPIYTTASTHPAVSIVTSILMQDITLSFEEVKDRLRRRLYPRSCREKMRW